MAKAKPGLRIILGLIFFVFGLNFFFHFLPIPMPQLSPQAAAFMQGLMGTGYFFYLLKFTEVISGALLLANLYVPLVLVILSPVIVNIFCFHTFMDHSGFPLALFIVLVQISLGYLYRDSYRGLFKRKA